MRVRTFRSLLIVCYVFGALTPQLLAQREQAPLSIEDALGASYLGLSAPIDLSPDGEWVAYTLQEPRKRESPHDERFVFFTHTGVPFIAAGCNVWITSTKSGESKNLTEGEGSSWGPVWSPNGSYLAFYSDRGGKASLWVWERSSGKLRQVSDVIVRSYSGIEVVRWTPDSRKILAKVLPEDMTLEDAANIIAGVRKQTNNEKKEKRSTVVVYSSDATSKQKDPKQTQPDSVRRGIYFSGYIGDLALVDIPSGKVQRIARGFIPHWYGISPDGANAAFTSIKGTETVGSAQFLYDLVVVPLLAGQPRVVASDIRLQVVGINVSWSPDGKLLSYITSGPLAKGEPFIVAVSGHEPRKVTEAPHPSFASRYRPPLWDAQGQFLYFLVSDTVWKVSIVDGIATALSKIPHRSIVEAMLPKEGGRFGFVDKDASLIVTTRRNETKQVGFYRVDLTSGKFSKLLEENKTYGPPYSFNASADGRSVVYLAQDAQHSPDLWIAATDFRNPRRLTRINSQLERYAMGASRLIEWRSMDGELLRGALLLPANYEEGKRYPLIVNVYGGAFLSNNVNRFGLGGISVENMQLFATRGYAVLYPDAPLRAGTPMQDLAKTVMPGVDKVIELGIADPDRIGVRGHSFGGYSTLCLIVQTTRFKAAVVSAATGNLVSAYGVMLKDGWSPNILWIEKGQVGIGGTPWEFRDRYIENSPVFYLDRVQTPLLITHGSLDVLPSFLAEEIFVGLRRLDREVVYAKYEGEEHWMGRWNYANQLDYCNRVIAWFDKHLKNTQQE